jgi:ketosteroid isomerase-like protein
VTVTPDAVGSRLTALEVVRASRSAIAEGDFVALIDLTDPRVQIYQSACLPWGGLHRGHAGLLSFLAGTQDLKRGAEGVHLFAAGERVVQVGRVRGVTPGSEDEFEAAEVVVWSVSGGRVIGVEVYADTSVLPSALGAAQPDNVSRLRAPRLWSDR